MSFQKLSGESLRQSEPDIKVKLDDTNPKLYQK